MQNSKHFLIIFRSCVDGSLSLKEGLDAAMVAAAFGQLVKILFEGDGVYHLLPKQAPEVLGGKAYHKALSALAMYDVDQLFVCSESLSNRGLALERLSLEPLKCLNHDQIVQMINASHAVIHY